MEIKFRAQRIFNNMPVEQDMNQFPELKSADGRVNEIYPNTLEIVIDGQAVKVAKIKELLAMRLKIKSVIDLYYDEWSNDEIAESIMKIINGQIQ